MVERICLNSSSAVSAQYAPPSQVAGVCGGVCLYDVRPRSRGQDRT